ncbi:transposase [Pelobium manganitolerans]|uniref:Transposase n=1 Tax=Pelobium manganitolerans TaxID=1842495 RepID=A0A419S5H4_9SPHI|nr:IS200/IS605 family transposase [Pelobium manganitolerans]RKD16104.1 transposase [Pelobium manganitolerans]
MSFVKVYIHLVWGTKNRYPFLESKELRLKLWNHIRENAKEKGVFVDHIGGYKEHCHCLISLGVDQSIQKTVQLIKGESAFWINQSGILKTASAHPVDEVVKFAWQKEYFAVSVSESMVQRVRDYIKNQEIHHAHKSYEEECDELIKKFGFYKERD